MFSTTTARENIVLKSDQFKFRRTWDNKAWGRSLDYTSSRTTLRHIPSSHHRVQTSHRLSGSRTRCTMTSGRFINWPLRMPASGKCVPSKQSVGTLEKALIVSCLLGFDEWSRWALACNGHHELWWCGYSVSINPASQLWVRKPEGSGKLASVYLGACGVLDGGVGALWRPGDALHHVLVLPQLRLAVFGGHDPHTHRLVVGAAGDQRAVLIGPNHADPLPVACEGLHAVANRQKKQRSHLAVVVDVVDRINTFKKKIGDLRMSMAGTYPVATSHIFMVLSLEAEMMWSPLGMMATDETLWSCPGKQKNNKTFQ